MEGKGSSLGDEGRIRVASGQAWRKGGSVTYFCLIVLNIPTSQMHSLARVRAGFPGGLGPW